MPSKVHAVLLVPAEGDPHGLLRDGPCNARPPATYLHECGCVDGIHRGCDCDSDTEPVRALVLAWGSEVVPEGCDRFLRCVGRTGFKYKPGDRFYAIEYVHTIAASWSKSGAGTLVLLDAEGREVTP